jgi:hypothetical protein
MTGSGHNGEANMSKRARITLQSETETKDDSAPVRDTKAASGPPPQTEQATPDHFKAATDTTGGSSTSSRGAALNTGTIIKVVVTGLAVAAALLLWKNRRF